ncbi:nuclear transport factor 2 family protein [Actinomadura sp. WAC 06369]|uniref:nuclear transport factor 2 family protein n=1 Tax=Actinomadura sp. WAC 06369 TaxID=2203193 RepID=UPI000F767CA4|nr:nuclear transport factor 2 family protein [Actinomadura sp. WAC 06369]RSN69368.1 phzA/B-like protein [Actinomadura sp. WAC 06369]
MTPRGLFARFQDNVLAGRPGLDEGMLGDGTVVETPFSPEGHRRFEGRDAVAAMLEAGRGLPVEFEAFRRVVVHETADPDVIVAEYELVARIPATGRRAAGAFVLVLRARDGRVAHWREYQDVGAMARAFAA